MRNKYPTMPDGTCADIYGNIVEGMDWQDKDAFFVFDAELGWWNALKR